MALSITKNFTTMGGISLSQLYIRFKISLSYNGKNINVKTEKYLSRDSYLEGLDTNVLPIKEIPENIEFDYDRLSDGNDILSFVHNKFKTYLSTDKTASLPMTDPSTGEYILDPSTGEVQFETVITRPKFAEESEISIVDLD